MSETKNKTDYPIAKLSYVSPSRTRLEMISNEPFFGQILLNLEVRETVSLPTAGVSWDSTRKRYIMYFNPVFFSYMTKEQQTAVFEHEFLHIILGHLNFRGGGKDATPQEHKLWNIAMDLAINSYVANLPNNIIFPHLIAQKDNASKAENNNSVTADDFKDKEEKSDEQELPEGLLRLVIPGQGIFAKYPPYLSSEQYYSLIISDENMKKKIMQMYGEDGELFDYHGNGCEGDKWDKENGEFKDNSKVRVGQDFDEIEKQAEAKRIAERAANNATKKQWGNCPKELAEYITSLLQPKIDWRAAFRYFILKSKRGTNYSSFRKHNRRIRDAKGDSIAPGRKINRTSSFLVAIDESGSVDENLMGEFVAELNNLCKFVTFTLIPFDTKVGEPWIWSKGKKVNTFKRTKTGGTDFNAPTAYFNDNKQYDGLVILTDMYASVPIPCRTTRIWVTNTEKIHSESIARGEPVLYIV